MCQNQSTSEISHSNLIRFLQLGVNKIFTPEADLSGLIYPLDKPIYVDRVVQKAFIDVNEDGVEAAASTAGKYLLNSKLTEPNEIS